MREAEQSIAWNSSQRQINKLPRPEQKITGPLKLECQGILCDLGATKKPAGITENGPADFGRGLELE
jgi:hypothetical protein